MCTCRRRLRGDLANEVDFLLEIVLVEGVGTHPATRATKTERTIIACRPKRVGDVVEIGK
jgi:hypothetical protein